MTYQDFRTALVGEADDNYRAFVAKGIPTDRPILGVRIPTVRTLVQGIPRDDLRTLIDEPPVALEEVIARGIMLSRLSYDEMLRLFDSQVSYIDDWCSCDTFCSCLKPLLRKHHADFFDRKIDPLLAENREFSTRLGLVLMFSYVTPDYLSVIYDRTETLKDREEYYVRMAIAWLLAECFIKYPDETLTYLKFTKLPRWAFNKAISKICDSRRIEQSTKSYLKTLRH